MSLKFTDCIPLANSKFSKSYSVLKKSNTFILSLYVLIGMWSLNTESQARVKNF